MLPLTWLLAKENKAFKSQHQGKNNFNWIVIEIGKLNMLLQKHLNTKIPI